MRVVHVSSSFPLHSGDSTAPFMEEMTAALAGRRHAVRVIVPHLEGLETGRWVLLDYIDFVVHVFHPQSRSFYQLEALWGDAPRHEITEEPPEA